MSTIEAVSRSDWRKAHEEFLAKEKAHMDASDRLAAERRRLPRMKVDKDYEFEGSNGRLSLADLFAGRKQLIVYHHMLKPNDKSPCPGCSMVGDQIPHLSHINARDTSLVFVARAPVGDINAFKERMTWDMPFYHTTQEFNADFDVPEYFGLNVFVRENSEIYRTYFTTGRGVETLGTPWSFLDLTPLGRQERWEDSPDNVPQSEPFKWWKLHDEYG